MMLGKAFAFYVTVLGTLCFPSMQKGDEVGQGTWAPTLESISLHEAPDWLLDAKLGVQFVGSPRNFDDTEWYHWSRAAQRVRQQGGIESDEYLREHVADIKVVGGIEYVWDIRAESDLEKTMEAYERIGAKFLVSMLWGAYPGTEGFLMTEQEVAAARRKGLKVGIHYNLLRRDGIPSIGDPGYVDWWRERVKRETRAIEADFLFFDGCQASSEYFKTPELVAWYYNWADANAKAVWVNEDLGIECREKWAFGDVLEGEGYTVSGISPKPFVNWDMLRNEWNCWVNEFGTHKRNGQRWEWIYKKPQDTLRVFVYNVSMGGVWCVQMVNTQKAWEHMYEIGDWLSVNGEAIYNTRPYGEPDPNCRRIPDGREGLPGTPNRPTDNSGHWLWRFEQTLAQAERYGDFYFTRNADYVYAIHWGLPQGDVVIPGIVAKPGSSITMLGLDDELKWHQNGTDVVVELNDVVPSRYAVSFRLSVE